jgi:hypothetical protein
VISGNENKLFVFDRDLKLIRQTPIECNVFRSALYVDNQGVFIGGTNYNIDIPIVKLLKYDLSGNFVKDLSLLDLENTIIPLCLQNDKGLLIISGIENSVKTPKNQKNMARFGYLVVDPVSLTIIRSESQKDFTILEKDEILINCFIHKSLGYIQSGDNPYSVDIIRLQDMQTIQKVVLPDKCPISQMQVDGNKLLILSVNLNAEKRRGFLFEYSLSGQFLTSQEFDTNKFLPGACFNIQKGKVYFPGIYGVTDDNWFLVINQLSNMLRQSNIIGNKNTQAAIYYPYACASESGLNLQNTNKFSPVIFQRGSGFGL